LPPRDKLAAVIDDVAKDLLHGRLKAVREALLWKLDAGHADILREAGPG
jgi:hypothetical protein